MYDKKYAEIVKNFLLLKKGASNLEISNLLNISEGTYYNWIRDYPEFLEAIKFGRMTATTNVARNLYECVMGKNVNITKTYKVEGGRRKLKEIKEETRAASIKDMLSYLAIKEPELYSEKIIIENRTSSNVIEYSSKEDLIEKMAETTDIETIENTMARLLLNRNSKTEEAEVVENE